MKCDKCGTELKGNESFCTKCGNPVLDRAKANEDNKLLGIAARLFDQQYQLLDGVSPADLGLVSDIEQDGSLSELTEEEFNQVIEIYKQFVQEVKLQKFLH